MATQKCPKCRSKRIRQGYRPTPILFKLIFRYNLLCDECNWEFNGFAIPGTVRKKTKKKKNFTESSDLKGVDHKNFTGDEILSSVELFGEPNNEQRKLQEPIIEEVPHMVELGNFQKHRTKFKKKVRIKLH